MKKYQFLLIYALALALMVVAVLALIAPPEPVEPASPDVTVFAIETTGFQAETQHVVIDISADGSLIAKTACGRELKVNAAEGPVKLTFVSKNDLGDYLSDNYHNFCGGIYEYFGY